MSYWSVWPDPDPQDVELAEQITGKPWKDDRPTPEEWVRTPYAEKVRTVRAQRAADLALAEIIRAERAEKESQA